MMPSRESRWAMLLDNGHVAPIYASSRAQALIRCEAWREARRRALAANSIATPRRVLAFISFKKAPADRAAARLGRKGGRARAAKLPASRRKEIAVKAATTRWIGREGCER